MLANSVSDKGIVFRYMKNSYEYAIKDKNCNLKR
jgi:hypothetical protein